MAGYKIMDADAHMCERPELWAERLTAEGVVTPDEVRAQEQERQLSSAARSPEAQPEAEHVAVRSFVGWWVDPPSRSAAEWMRNARPPCPLCCTPTTTINSIKSE